MHFFWVFFILIKQIKLYKKLQINIHASVLYKAGEKIKSWRKLTKCINSFAKNSRVLKLSRKYRVSQVYSSRIQDSILWPKIRFFCTTKVFRKTPPFRATAPQSLRKEIILFSIVATVMNQMSWKLENGSNFMRSLVFFDLRKGEKLLQGEVLGGVWS